MFTALLLVAAAPAFAGPGHGHDFPAVPDFLEDGGLEDKGNVGPVGLRCGTPTASDRTALYGHLEPSPFLKGVPADCSAGSTNPTDAYDPGDIIEIKVVVHVIMNDACSDGVISDEMVQSQIDILNEDFQALGGTNGAPGNYGGIQFVLADTDPQGNPTTGITRSCNSVWFGDGGGYFNSLAWDPNRYMNMYTNENAALGYVPFLPADAGGSLVGGNNDRVVVLWDTFGRNGSYGPPYNLGRTGTHEVGHYLGLEHTFTGGCAAASPPDCYNSGDLICDTNSEQFPSGNPCGLGDKVTCGTVDPSDNYMDYSDDICMNKFTVEQVRRMRCTLQSYRPGLINIVSSAEVFESDFEGGTTGDWDSELP